MEKINDKFLLIGKLRGNDLVRTFIAAQAKNAETYRPASCKKETGWCFGEATAFYRCIDKTYARQDNMSFLQ